MSTHYSCALEAMKLAKFASEAAGNLYQLLEEDKIGLTRIVLAYRGMSGIALATALYLQIFRVFHVDVGMCYVRKQSEYKDCHGYKVERNTYSSGSELVFVFVDDFVSSGHTLAQTQEGIKERFDRSKGIKYVVLSSAHSPAINEELNYRKNINNAAIAIPEHVNSEQVPMYIRDHFTTTEVKTGKKDIKTFRYYCS